jgi:MSHA biogenesis protein MshJ
VVKEIRSALQAAAARLISPREMAHFLEQLVLQESELELLRLNTLEPEPLIEPSSKDPSTIGLGAAGSLHRHAFDIEFSGNYLATLRYLEALEALPWQFFWDSVDYEVIDYPRSVVRLRLHTLSLSEDWIGV